MMIDILRSIHCGQASSFATFEISTSTGRQGSQGRSYYTLSQVSEDHPQYALVSIITLLGDIHTAETVLGPFSAESSSGIEDKYSPGAEIPFTPRREMYDLRQKLLIALQEWKSRYYSVTPKHVVLLYLFCNLLYLVPHLQSLITLSGYPPRRVERGRAERIKMRVMKERHVHRAAVPVAWQILETSEQIPTADLPLWAALSVFSAGLVVWASITLPGKNDSSAIPPRLLASFQKELLRINMPCAMEMATTMAQIHEEASKEIRAREG